MNAIDTKLPPLEFRAVPAPAKRRAGIDALRVSMCLFVIAWHVKVLGTVPMTANRPRGFSELTLLDILNENILLVAVPCFLTVSAWLLFERATWAYFGRRLVWLGTAYLFWSAVYSLYWRLPLACQPVSVSCVTYKVLTGNGAPVNYYFVAQMICDLLLVGLVELRPSRGRWAACMLMLVWASNTALAFTGAWPPADLFYNPLNFVGIPALVYLVRASAWNLTAPKNRVVLAGASVALAALEYAVFVWDVARYPGYARPSFLATSLLLVSFALPDRKGPRWLSWAASATFGVFCVHFLVIGHLGITPATSAGAASVWTFFVVATVSTAATVALRFAFRQRLA